MCIIYWRYVWFDIKLIIFQLILSISYDSFLIKILLYLKYYTEIEIECSA